MFSKGKTFDVLLIVKCYKNLVGDKGKRTNNLKGKIPLPFDIYINPKCQPLRGDYRGIFAAINST